MPWDGGTDVVCMIDSQVNLELMHFVESTILPRYAAFDKAHSISHAVSVIRRSIALARQLGAEVNMAYTVAAYHDLGLEGPRAIHHVTSGKILAADARLKRWFNPAQIKIMKEAVEDHRASASHAPRSIYGKIVAEADRDLSPEVVIRRTIQFSLAKYPLLDDEGQWNRFLEHMHSKYAAGGYVKLWIPGSENEQQLKKLRSMIEQPDSLKQTFLDILKEERKSQNP